MLPPQMSHILKWLAPHKDDSTMVMCCEGRSKACRRKLGDWVSENYPDECKQAEMWVTDAGLTAGADPREPQRRVAFSDTCRESVLVGLGACLFQRRCSRPSLAPCFTARGEVGTHSQACSAVPNTCLESLPRLPKAEKQATIGENGRPHPCQQGMVEPGGCAKR